VRQSAVDTSEISIGGEASLGLAFRIENQAIGLHLNAVTVTAKLSEGATLPENTRVALELHVDSNRDGLLDADSTALAVGESVLLGQADRRDAVLLDLLNEGGSPHEIKPVQKEYFIVTATLLQDKAAALPLLLPNILGLGLMLLLTMIGLPVLVGHLQISRVRLAFGMLLVAAMPSACVFREVSLDSIVEQGDLVLSIESELHVQVSAVNPSPQVAPEIIVLNKLVSPISHTIKMKAPGSDAAPR